MGQIHKRFTTDEVKTLIQRYIDHEIERHHVESTLGIGKTRFFKLLNRYRENSETFSINYSRKAAPPQIDPSTEQNIVKELLIDKGAIEDKNIPLYRYNYSYIKRRLESEYNQHVSLPTIINRAKKHACYRKRKQHKTHDREVITRYVGELIQHDSSFHLWAPAAQEKWYLITSLDDCSRFILYAALLKKESTWAHILALQTLVLQHGVPHSYYVDSHSIFRFVRGRDEFHSQHHLLTDQVDPQWKQVTTDLGIKIIYALSPQAKGKIERPYSWLQDHLVRTCIREDVTDIRIARDILTKEVHEYNHKRIHSTTGEIPYLRLQNYLNQKQSLFRDFKIRPPFKSTKDIFCLRFERTVDAYRKISFDTIEFKVNGASPHQQICLRIHPLNPQLSEIRFWYGDKLLDIQNVKNDQIKAVHF